MNEMVCCYCIVLYCKERIVQGRRDRQSRLDPTLDFVERHESFGLVVNHG